jgi:hypothetical protein
MVRDYNGHVLAYLQFEEEPGRRAAANKDEAQPAVARQLSQLQYVDVKPSCVWGAFSMRVVVYDQAGDVAFDFYTQKDTVSLCPGRLEKAQVVEALQEAAFFILDAPAPSPEARNFRQHVFEGDHGE